MPVMEHPRNFTDHSGDSGFQWEYFCDICHNGYKTTFIQSKSKSSSRKMKGFGSALSIAGGFLGSRTLDTAGDASTTAGQYRDHDQAWRQEHDAAFQQSVNECMRFFKRCPRCTHWVCENDWNATGQLCKNCAPRLQEEMEAQRAQLQVQQMQQKMATQQHFSGDTSQKQVICPRCGKPNEGVKFCGNCGGPLGAQICPHCQKPVPQGQRFCGECGGKIG